MKKTFLILTTLTMLMCGLTVSASADSASGTLFYTTFAGGTNVHEINYDFNGTALMLSGDTGLAATNGADGLLFAPDGNLLVAGQGNNLTEVTSGGTIVKTVTPGGGSFHLALTSSAPNALVYNMANGGCGSNCISAVALLGGGLSANGVLYTVSAPGCAACSLDVRGVILDPLNRTFYYGTAPDGGSGDFGTVAFNDTTHTATLTRLQTGLFAHGLSFDPFTGNLIVNSGNTIQQLDAAGNVVVNGTVTGPGSFDQAAVDGHGHLFVASNSGFLQFVDYDATGKIGDPTNFKAAPFLAGALDDIAPLSGVGSTPVPPGAIPEPATFLLLGSGLAGLAGWRRWGTQR